MNVDERTKDGGRPKMQKRNSGFLPKNAFTRVCTIQLGKDTSLVKLNTFCLCADINWAGRGIMD